MLINDKKARHRIFGGAHGDGVVRQSLYTGQNFPREGILSNAHRRISHPTVSIGQAPLMRDPQAHALTTQPKRLLLIKNNH